MAQLPSGHCWQTSGNTQSDAVEQPPGLVPQTSWQVPSWQAGTAQVPSPQSRQISMAVQSESALHVPPGSPGLPAHEYAQVPFSHVDSAQVPSPQSSQTASQSTSPAQVMGGGPPLPHVQPQVPFRQSISAHEPSAHTWQISICGQSAGTVHSPPGGESHWNPQAPLTHAATPQVPSAQTRQISGITAQSVSTEQAPWVGQAF